MSFFEVIILAVSLAMDAFAVSVCKGLSIKELRTRDAVTVGAWFGIFQALMPVIGYFLGGLFANYIEKVDHWIAFVLLALIGVNMIIESRRSKDETHSASLAVKEMALLAVATSIDALAVGVTFAFLDVSIAPAALTIGVVTFALSMAGVKLGHIFGAKGRKTAELCGGIALVLIGSKILLEHLGVFA